MAADKTTRKSTNPSKKRKDKSLPSIKELIPHSEELSERHKNFVKEYCLDFNAGRAAATLGYTKRTAYQVGCDLMKNLYIRKAVNKRLEEIGAMIDVKEERIVAEIEKYALGNEKTDATNKRKYVEMLGRVKGIFKDGIIHSGSIDTTIIDPKKLTDEQLRRLAEIQSTIGEDGARDDK